MGLLDCSVRLACGEARGFVLDDDEESSLKDDGERAAARWPAAYVSVLVEVIASGSCGAAAARWRCDFPLIWRSKSIDEVHRTAHVVQCHNEVLEACAMQTGRVAARSMDPNARTHTLLRAGGTLHQ